MAPADSLKIQNVSDTALWVATYRAVETTRADALFRDPYAALLAGEKGKAIAQSMKGSRYVSWSVVIRTCVIDDWIRQQIKEGVIDTVLNLGAGLDARPYRMDLPAQLKWIEIDFPHMITYKEELLKNEKPRCTLERIGLDLSDRALRKKVLAQIASHSKNILVLTEGVIPYLSEEQVAELAEDLRSHKEFRFWILDYFTSQFRKYIKRAGMQRQLKNAPMRFFPPDWSLFFSGHGWKVREIRYYASESLRLGRAIPMPRLMKIIFYLMPKGLRNRGGKFAGYALLEP